MLLSHYPTEITIFRPILHRLDAVKGRVGNIFINTFVILVETLLKE